MKVLFVASDNNPSSGAFLSMVKLTSLLQDEFGVEIKVIVPREGEGVKLLEEKKISYELVRSFDWVIDNNTMSSGLKSVARNCASVLTNPKAVRTLSKIIRDEGFDLVHLNTTYSHTGALAALQAKVPFIWHLREMLEEDQGRRLKNRELGYNLIGKADRIIAISSCVYDKYRALIPNGKLVKIFNGIDVERFYTPGRSIMKDPKQFTLIYGGGYARRKGIYELASALNYLSLNNINNFRLLMIGEANQKYRDYLHKSGLDSKIRYLGYQKDVEQWYRQADIAFSCSAMEAFGRKTIEAMLCGCLMIGSNTGGNLDTIKDRETGLLYEQGDPLSLAYTILYAMNHIDETKALAKAGQEYARQHFTAYDNAQAVYEVYQDVLKNG